MPLLTGATRLELALGKTVSVRVLVCVAVSVTCKGSIHVSFKDHQKFVH